MKKIAALFALRAVFALVGCNTVQGIGQDIQKGGQVLEDAAKKK
jgi:predicted small secreted protein